MPKRSLSPDLARLKTEVIKSKPRFYLERWTDASPYWYRCHQEGHNQKTLEEARRVLEHETKDRHTPGTNWYAPDWRFRIIEETTTKIAHTP